MNQKSPSSNPKLKQWRKVDMHFYVRVSSYGIVDKKRSTTAIKS